MSKIVIGMGLAALLVMGTGCAADEGEEESVGETEDRLLAGRRVSTGEVASLLRQAGFPESAIGRMVCTAKYESSFYERASNRNRNGSTDRGLFQINSIHLGDRACPSSGEALYSASTNARCALQIFRQQGMNAWYGYKKHRSECDRYPAPGSAPAPSTSDDASDDATTPTTPTAPADDGEGGCWSGTLEEMVDARTCVQSKFNDVWYQCRDGQWYRGVSGNQGPFGACTSTHPL